MKISIKIMGVLIMLGSLSFCYGQNPKFEFEFGKTTSMESVASDRNERHNFLKWVNVNTSDTTWKVGDDGVLICAGQPIGVVRSGKQYENFVLHVEWRHMKQGGNSGVFVWSSASLKDGRNLPDGVEVQMLDLGWIELNTPKGGVMPLDKVAHAHGELFGVDGVQIVADNPKPTGPRSMSIENRVKKGWNTYDVVCVDGVIKLAVNGKFVNGVSKSTQKKGYLCLESEGGEIHFRNLNIIELPPGMASPDEVPPELN
jgi:hypothetical protein